MLPHSPLSCPMNLHTIPPQSINFNPLLTSKNWAHYRLGWHQNCRSRPQLEYWCLGIWVWLWCLFSPAPAYRICSCCPSARTCSSSGSTRWRHGCEIWRCLRRSSHRCLCVAPSLFLASRRSLRSGKSYLLCWIGGASATGWCRVWEVWGCRPCRTSCCPCRCGTWRQSCTSRRLGQPS